MYADVATVDIGRNGLGNIGTAQQDSVELLHAFVDQFLICERGQLGRIVLPGITEKDAVIGITVVVTIGIDVMHEAVGNKDLRQGRMLVEKALL